MEILADHDHLLVRDTAQRLTQTETTLRGRLEQLFHFVRDDVRFAFPIDGDFVKASETIQLGYGQCNTKATLLLALCKVVDIPARIHFSLITKDMRPQIVAGDKHNADELIGAAAHHFSIRLGELCAD